MKLKEKQAHLVLEYDTSRIGQPIHAKHTARQIEIYQTLRKINQRGLRLSDDGEDAKNRYELLSSRRTSSRDEISRMLVMAASRIDTDVEKDHLWIKKELEILRILYPLVGRKVYSLLPKKSCGEIASKVQLMGLKLMNYPCPLSLEEKDAVYLAGIIDGEGSIGIHEATSGKGKNYFQPKISINNSDIRLIEWVSKILFDFRLYYAKENPPNRKIVYHALVIGVAPVHAVLSAIYPSLLLKKERAALVLEYTGSRIGKPKSQPYTERQKEIYHILREMHQKGI